jgi:glycine cleavage system aminomethyltransferase T
MGFDAEYMGLNFGDGQAEARATRQSCCLFNFSFLARARLEGPGAPSTILRLTQRPLSDMNVGEIRYALHCVAAGHAVSDLTIWRVDHSVFEVFSGLQGDIDFLGSAIEGCRLTDLGGSAVLALQGPQSLAVLAEIADVEAIARLRYFTFCRATIADCECNVGRLGYTGEAGFEIITENRGNLQKLWDALSRVARPAGYQAAEILRIEAGFPLFCQEFQIPVFPNELGLGKYDGRKQGRARLKLISFCALGLTPDQIWTPSPPLAPPGNAGVIAVTSACYSPLAQATLGLGFILADTCQKSSQLIDINSEFKNISVVSRPFFDPAKLRPRQPWR